MKRIFTFILLFVCLLNMQAQSLAVQSFRMDETDLTANTAGTTVIDQNGQKCALIKVETTQQGFSFDAGTLGVVKTEQKVGEIWVYVPEGVKRLTISHQQLGVLRDYDLGQTLKRAKTYILKLTAGEVQTIVKQARTSQYVVFQLSPSNAVVELDGEMLNTTDGTAQKMMRFGSYNYRVQAPNYLPEVGKVVINDPKQKHIVNVQLKPNFSQVTLKVDDDAEIWINGQKHGNGSWTGNLGAGVYEIETRKAGHRSQTITRDIQVSNEPQIIMLNAPIPIYGEADISSTPAMADIYIDNVKRGQTPQLVENLVIGQHQVRLSKKGYDDYNGIVTIHEGETTPFSAMLSNVATITGNSTNPDTTLHNIDDIDQEARNIYQRTKDNIGPDGLVNVSQILFMIGQNPSDSLKSAKKALADSVYYALKNGADFGTLAMTKSDDKVTAKRGGELGWIFKGQTIPAFDEVAFSMQDGEISKPVLSEIGYHIIKVDGHKQLEPYDTLKKDIYNYIEKRRSRESHDKNRLK